MEISWNFVSPKKWEPWKPHVVKAQHNAEEALLVCIEMRHSVNLMNFIIVSLIPTCLSIKSDCLSITV